MAKLIQVIENEVTRGIGTEMDPCRIVRQWWTPDGVLLAESDPLAPPVRLLLSELDAQLQTQYSDVSSMHPWWQQFWPRLRAVLGRSK